MEPNSPTLQLVLRGKSYSKVSVLVEVLLAGHELIISYRLRTRDNLDCLTGKTTLGTDLVMVSGLLMFTSLSLP